MLGPDRVEFEKPALANTDCYYEQRAQLPAAYFKNPQDSA